MHKKVSTSKSKSLHCLECKSASSKHILYVCESGHILCKNCQKHGKEFEKKQGSGDSQNNIQPLNCLHCKCNKVMLHPRLDLASGDYKECLEHTDRNTNYAAVENENEDKKITVQYKNLNYSDSKSSTLTVKKHLKNETILEDTPALANSQLIARPIGCPDCKKMVSINALSQHFQFDHSKTPCLLLMPNVAQLLSIKISNILPETRCLALYVEKIKERPSDSNDSRNVIRRHSNNYPLLLMGAKINTQFTQNQTKYIKSINKNGKNSLSSYIEKHKYMPRAKHTFDDNDALVLWLCRIEDVKNIYNITISHKDKKLSHSYTGEPIDIQDNQDILVIYQRSECLIIHGNAVNQNQINVTVTISI